jgi:hypothetical protein
MIEIITAICFSFFFVEMHQFHKKLKIEFKPFNCVSCLASWTALGLYFVPNYILNASLVMFVSGVFAPLFIKLYQKLYYGIK